ncbi:hypothetical protein Salat_1338400 [Sesamum alatum]|uniref:PGG domain-containing protein n=1 Tax=Sesamum alatum TaxID=300844 RepID=A0AAE1YHZ7_9LAMI|nr:hypothetical protein Salat_1338400 [Sesamum alatum]
MAMSSGSGIVPETLTEDNYEFWKRCLKNYLIGHGLWGVVSGKETMPDKETQKQQHEEWKRKNALALHAIQVCCGAGIYSKFHKAHISAEYAWTLLAEKVLQPRQLPLSDEEQPQPEDTGSKDYLKYEELYKAIEAGDLSRTQRLIRQNPDAVRARVSSDKDTALHIAILSGQLKIAEYLVSEMTATDLELTNQYDATGLSLAAVCGAKNLASVIMRKNKKLLSMGKEHEDGQLPVIVAALYGQKRMVRYLYRHTPESLVSPEKGKNGVMLLNSLITAEIYDVASKLLKRYPKLGVTPDQNGQYALKILAEKPSAFPSGLKLAFWQKWIYNSVRIDSPWDGDEQKQHRREERTETQAFSSLADHTDSILEIQEPIMEEEIDEPQTTSIRVHNLFQKLGWGILQMFVPNIKYILVRKLVHDESIKLVRSMFKEMRKLSTQELEKMDIDSIIYDAVKHGITEFITEMLEYKPEFMWRKDRKGRTVFGHAIVLRQEKIFNLIYGLGAKKNMIARTQDVFRNNYLHLAAKLSPPDRLERLSGAALQMQRELQWFKEVESIVQPKLKEEENENNKTPQTLFTDEHKQLVRDGESWMKNTAGSSMIVGTLIAAVMFTTAFTVPGGNKTDNTGLPTMLDSQPRPFLIFMVSNALSMFSATTSLLMFLGILTARYAERDFLKSLPTKLIFGLAALFLSIVTMMASFGAALYLMLHDRLSWVTVPIIILAVIPIVLFSFSQFPLLIEMTKCTYGSGIFDKRPKKKETLPDFLSRRGRILSRIKSIKK